MMDDELAAAIEEVCERLAALLGFERIALLDLQPGKPSSLGGKPVPPRMCAFSISSEAFRAGLCFAVPTATGAPKLLKLQLTLTQRPCS